MEEGEEHLHSFLVDRAKEIMSKNGNKKHMMIREVFLHLQQLGNSYLLLVIGFHKKYPELFSLSTVVGLNSAEDLYYELVTASQRLYQSMEKKGRRKKYTLFKLTTYTASNTQEEENEEQVEEKGEVENNQATQSNPQISQHLKSMGELASSIDISLVRNSTKFYSVYSYLRKYPYHKWLIFSSW